MPNGEPETGVSAPPEPTENTDTVLSTLLAVASSRPPGLNATDRGSVPVVNGEPATGGKSRRLRQRTPSARQDARPNHKADHQPPTRASTETARHHAPSIHLTGATDTVPSGPREEPQYIPPRAYTVTCMDKPRPEPQ